MASNQLLILQEENALLRRELLLNKEVGQDLMDDLHRGVITSGEVADKFGEYLQLFTLIGVNKCVNSAICFSCCESETGKRKRKFEEIQRQGAKSAESDDQGEILLGCELPWLLYYVFILLSPDSVKR